jgi:ketol-acid reductoisomerase
VERTYRLLREGGYAAQFEHHSPTSQYGQLSRRSRFDHYDIAVTMREIVDGIDSGAFADEWDAERDAGYPELVAMRAAAAGPEVAAFERDLRTRLGEGARRGTPGRRPNHEAEVLRGRGPVAVGARRLAA